VWLSPEQGASLLQQHAGQPLKPVDKQADKECDRVCSGRKTGKSVA
jgi:hypothetical protein